MGVTISNVVLSSDHMVLIYTPYQAPAPMGGNGGSALFDGIESNLTVPGSADWAPGTGDFTIEWWQYAMSGGGAAQRIFSIGGYPSASIAVSQEGENSFYFWANGDPQINFSISNINNWFHYAIVCQSGVTTIYENGSSVGSTSTSFDVSDASTPLSLGAEYQTDAASSTFYNGYLTNFRWVDGVAVYTANFTPPTSPLTAISGTKLLMLETSAPTVLTDTAQHLTVTDVNNTVTWASATPF